MAAVKTTWKDPKYDQFIARVGPILGFQTVQLFDAFRKEFPEKGISFKAFLNHAAMLKAERITIPTAIVPEVQEMVLRLPWKTVLITSDYQIPYLDEELTRKAFELGAAWQVEGHVMNADVYDMATMSKFSPQVYGERVLLGEEIEMGKQLIQESKRLHGKVALLTGNHEWRLLARILQAELKTDQVRDLLADEGVLYTPLSYCWLGYDEDQPVRITHPKSASVIAGAVGADIARNHDCHVVVAHDHLLALRRSHSGRWTVAHSGMMAKPGKLMYAVAADDRRPLMTQGFVIVHPDSKTGEPRIRLVDPRNTDWDLEFWTARKEKQ